MGQRGGADESAAERVWRYWRLPLGGRKPDRTGVCEGSESGSERGWEHELGGDCVKASDKSWMEVEVFPEYRWVGPKRHVSFSS